MAPGATVFEEGEKRPLNLACPGAGSLVYAWNSGDFLLLIAHTASAIQPTVKAAPHDASDTGLIESGLTKSIVQPNVTLNHLF